MRADYLASLGSEVADSGGAGVENLEIEAVDVDELDDAEGMA